MLILLESLAPQNEVKNIVTLLHQHRLEHLVSRSLSQMMIGISSACPEVVLDQLRKISCIQKIIPVDSPYKMASRLCKPEGTVIKIPAATEMIEIGGEKIILMAGPCAIESQEQLETISRELEGSKVSVLRASAYKPRTSPYSFQGMGEEGLVMHRDAQKKHRLLIETEVMDIRAVSLVAAHVDIVRIGARNMQNFDLLKEVARCGKPIILKRGISATVEELLMSAE